MKKVKYLVIFCMVAMLILAFPNIANAAEEYTYSDTEQGIEWSYELDDSENVINLRCKTTSKTGAVTIPSTIDGKTVISLADSTWNNGAFEDCMGITEVTIPNTIVTIGSSAFRNCTGLKTITIPDSVIKIESDAFYGCKGMTSITLSGNLSVIGSSAFEKCTGLRTVTMPDSVTTIGKSAFEGCTGLKEITLSNNLSEIPGLAFYECKGLTSVVLPESVTTIGGEYEWYGAFGKCTNLEKVLIPDTVATIEEGAFGGCSKLTIYGNDGQTSKTYAEDKGINFKYISQWNESEVGDDITPPTVEEIEVPYSSVHSYYDSNSTTFIVPTGKELIINVKFSEDILATTVPTLTIKFGNGKNVEVTEAAVAGSTIAYKYTIAKDDVGMMTAVSLAGGDVKDAAGNEATLTCPELKVYWGNNHFVYANGTAIDVEDGNNNNDNNNNNNDNNDNNNNDNNNNDNSNPPTDDTNKPADGTNKPADTTTKPDTSNKEDNTTATGKLPQTGLSMGIILAIVAALAGCVIIYFKYNKLRGI